MYNYEQINDEVANILNPLQFEAKLSERSLTLVYTTLKKCSENEVFLHRLYAASIGPSLVNEDLVGLVRSYRNQRLLEQMKHIFVDDLQYDSDKQLYFFSVPRRLSWDEYGNENLVVEYLDFTLFLPDFNLDYIGALRNETQKIFTIIDQNKLVQH